MTFIRADSNVNQCIKQLVKWVVNICVEKTGESALKSHAKPSS